MRHGLAWLAIAFLAAPGRAVAQGETIGPTGITYSHKGQVGANVALGVGYRAIFPYDDEDYCGEASRTCTDTTPPFLELGVTYGVSRSVELLGDARLGLGTDFKPRFAGDAPRPLSFDLGARIYLDDTGSLKLFTSILAHFDRTDYSASGASASTDVGVRNVNGLLLDFHRTFGLVVSFGETLSFVRWLRFEVDAGFGIQARFP